MDVGVIIYWNTHPWITSHAGGPKRWLSFYILAMQAFGADTLLLVNAPEIKHGYDINFKQYDTIEELLKDYEDYKIVTLTGKTEKTLKEFKHPEGKVLYLVGDDYGDVPDIEGDKIKIENCKNSNLLWSHNCVAIALYDKHIKNDSNK